MILVSKVSCWRIKISFEVFVCTCLKVFNHFISNLQGNFWFTVHEKSKSKCALYRVSSRFTFNNIWVSCLQIFSTWNWLSRKFSTVLPRFWVVASTDINLILDCARRKTDLFSWQKTFSMIMILIRGEESWKVIIDIQW